MKLSSTCYGVSLMGMLAAPVLAQHQGGLHQGMKAMYDFRSDDDRDNPLGCVNPEGDEVRYLQVEVFDYNASPRIFAKWTQISDKCGKPITGGATYTMEYYAGEPVPEDSIYTRVYGTIHRPKKFPDKFNGRLQMDMYICAPWGKYELLVTTSSTNDGKGLKTIAWEIEYGPDEYHIWDVLNTPFFTTRKEGNPTVKFGGGYSPIPSHDKDGGSTTYKWPFAGSQGYYSEMYSGPFPPLTSEACPNLLPDGVQEYEGCFDAADQVGWTSSDGPMGSYNEKDAAEPYRMFDGLGGRYDFGVETEGVMTLEKCAGICAGYQYFGLQAAIMCRCGDDISGQDTKNCGLIDDDFIPEYQYLCSGDSRVLCGTDTKMSIYSTYNKISFDEPVGAYFELGCAFDPFRGRNEQRVMEFGPERRPAAMSAEICFDICSKEHPGFAYFGTQFGKECFCDTDFSADLGYHRCNKVCAGNSREICGGVNALTVYQVGDREPTPKPTPKPAPMPAPKPNPEPVGAYSELGCAFDPFQGRGNPRVMEFGPERRLTMSAEICFDICSKEHPGFTYFGTQFGKECFCDTDFSTDLGYHRCNKACAGNGPEICGGVNALTVYQVGHFRPPPKHVEAYSDLGCASDPNWGKNKPRVMKLGPETIGKAMSAEICFGICEEKLPDFTYFGTQYGKECWCDTDFSENLGHDGCDMVCSRNSPEICGGEDALTVYRAHPQAGCQSVVIEAEDILRSVDESMWGGWTLLEDTTYASGGEYISWMGLKDNNENNKFYFQGDPIFYDVDIPFPGIYNFKFMMRQPAAIDPDKANDAWVSFPDATRFGPLKGGSYPTHAKNDGFIKVFGNNRKPVFKVSGRGSVDDKVSEVAVEFEEAGPTTMGIAGRSHAFMIDQILLYPYPSCD